MYDVWVHACMSVCECTLLMCAVNRLAGQEISATVQLRQQCQLCLFALPDLPSSLLPTGHCPLKLIRMNPINTDPVPSKRDWQMGVLEGYRRKSSAVYRPARSSFLSSGNLHFPMSLSREFLHCPVHLPNTTPTPD